MVKSPVSKKEKEKALVTSSVSSTSSSSPSCKYTGVRKRKWGKYVSEIRLPNSRERIWLGSYDTAEKAARAFDAAQFCLRGPNARFNFPDNPPDIENGMSMTPADIQVAAARFAHSDPLGQGRAHNMDSQSESLSSCELTHHVWSPCASVSNGTPQVLDNENTEMPLDNKILDQFLTLGNEGNNVQDYGLFPGFDDLSSDYYVPPFPSCGEYWPDNNYDNNGYEDISSSQGSFLWNF